MNDITRQFLKTTNIPETPNHTVEHILEFLTLPESVNKMIIMSSLGLPSLSGVVKDLEKKFANSDFPLGGKDRAERIKNAPNRRNVGWMVRFVMREFGYTPRKLSVQPRIGNFSGSECFTTAAIYEKTIDNPDYNISIMVNENVGLAR